MFADGHLPWQGATAMLHRQAVKLAIGLGPHNPGVLFYLKRACRGYGYELHDRGDCLEVRKDNRSILIPQKHFIHARTIAREFDVFFDAVVCEQSNGRFVVDYSRPRLHTCKSSGLQFELAGFSERSDVVKGYLHWYTPNPGDCVFDIGANCGISTYRFSKLVGHEGKVIALEPDPLNYALLRRNIARHNLRNVVAVHAAVANKRGLARFYADGSLGSCLADLPSVGTVARVQFVPTVTLADAFARWGEPDFCKIDIEGAEIQVLASAKDLLAEARTHFALDTSHIVRGQPTARSIERIFRESGFEVESAVISGAMTTWAKPVVNPVAAPEVAHRAA